MTHVAMAVGRDGEVPATDFAVARIEPMDTAAWTWKRAVTVRAQGCPWACTYCRVPALQDCDVPGRIPWRDVMTHLSAKAKSLDAVVFSGGEPTRQLALVSAMREARSLGVGIGLHSAGAFPARLHDALHDVDWLALDIKAMPEGYHDITGKHAAGARAWASLDIAIAWGGPLEVRVTVDPTTHTRESVLSIIHRVRAVGGPMPLLQEATEEGTSIEFRTALSGRGLNDVMGPDLDGLLVQERRPHAATRLGAP